MIIYHEKREFIARKQGRFYIFKPINALYHINKKKDKNNLIISKDE